MKLLLVSLLLAIFLSFNPYTRGLIDTFEFHATKGVAVAILIFAALGFMFTIYCAFEIFAEWLSGHFNWMRLDD